MRVAVCGTHGIGKTTLVETIFEHYYDHPKPPFYCRLDEVARDVAHEMGYDTLSDIKYWEPDRRNYFQWLVHMSQVTNEVGLASFISDRSVVDNLAYTMYYDCPSHMVAALTDFVRMHVSTYDLLLYLPIPDEMVMLDAKDGFRMTDFASMQAIDHIMFQLFEDEIVSCEKRVLGTKRASWFDEAIYEIEGFER